MCASSRITLDAVADAAGVSRITVSRAFSNPERLRTDTLDHVLRTAAELGYRPKRAPASTQNAPTARRIGVVSPDMDNPFFGRIASSINRLGFEEDIDIVMYDSFESEAQENRIIHRLIAQKVDAIILSVISSDVMYQTRQPQWLEALEAARIPLILVDREINVPHFGGVYIDNLDCGYQAGRWMIDQSIDDVLVVSGPSDSLVSIGRTSGIREALGSAAQVDVRYADFTMDPAYHLMKQRLQEAPPPKGIIGINNQISLGILKACAEQKLYPGRGITLFSIDEVGLADVFGMHIPCMRLDTDEMAARALSMALQATRHDVGGGTRMIVRGKLKP
ncbi:LacI family DNA-binding transcriptional regulator [Larsenimonas salina]|uniref:LacI family DNA-binding transcriptional regulator n=1 Tax=Larsenimonas salina TaxID=1295565 RepID=UPI0020749CEA|nr:LacI family DNA-binding transcriptional regulator [Larsenimonas salina]MCM5704172.1 LacI family transcriptional regulator [Larsenimonas salina]